MSTPRALKPFLGAGSRFLVDQLVPRSAGASPSSRFLSRPPASVCLSCRYSSAFTRRQLRFSSTSGSSSSSHSKPPGDSNNPNSEKGPDGKDPAHQSGSPEPSSSSPPSPSSFSPFTIPLSQEPPPPQQEQAPPKEQEQAPPTQEEKPSPRLSPNIDLPSALNSRRSALNQTLSSFMDRAQTTLFTASRRISDLTGYSGIEALKSQISALESSLSDAQAHLHASRDKYKSSVSQRSSTQREVTTLLARQKTWTPADFERFTDLYRKDYDLDADVAQAARELEEAEREAERLGRELSSGILSRYHEEQIWSDKIRRMSTWGTWGLMGVNILLFLVLQFGAEPWRRQRLVRGFEEKVREALAEERQKEQKVREKERVTEREWQEAMNIRIGAIPPSVMVDAVGSEQAGVSEAEAVPEPAPAPEPKFEMPSEPRIPPFTSVTWREVLTDPEWWKDTFAELSSERKVAIRMRDVSIIALEGMVAGVTIAGTMAIVLIRWA